MSRAAYEEDFYAWTRQQAAALRRLAELRPNLPVDLDLDLLAEEIEALGREDRYCVERELESVLEHLLLLAWSPAVRPRLSWQNLVDRARGEIARRLTPTLRREIEARLPELYDIARRCAEEVLRQHHEDEAAGALPERCPWSLDRILDEEFWPENRWQFAG